MNEQLRRDIQCWQRITGMVLQPWQEEFIEKFLITMNENQKGASNDTLDSMLVGNKTTALYIDEFLTD